MAKGKKTFIFYSDWINMVREMPDKDAGALLKHVLSYVNDEDPKTDNILVKMAFGHMKPLIKSDLDKWESIREDRKKAGHLGGKASAKQKQASAKQVEAVNVNVNVNDNVNDNNNVNKILMSEANASNVTEKNINYLELSKAYFKLFESNSNSLDVDWVHLKKISAKKFIDPIRLMIEQDGRTAEDLIKVGEFLKVDDFWKQNIQSTTKLREKFDQLITKAKNGKQKGNSALKNALRNYESNFDS